MGKYSGASVTYRGVKELTLSLLKETQHHSSHSHRLLLFNDSACAIAPSTEHLADANKLPLEIQRLALHRSRLRNQ